MCTYEWLFFDWKKRERAEDNNSNNKKLMCARVFRKLCMPTERISRNRYERRFTKMTTMVTTKKVLQKLFLVFCTDMKIANKKKSVNWSTQTCISTANLCCCCFSIFCFCLSLAFHNVVLLFMLHLFIRSNRNSFNETFINAFAYSFFSSSWIQIMQR